MSCSLLQTATILTHCSNPERRTDIGQCSVIDEGSELVCKECLLEPCGKGEAVVLLCGGASCREHEVLEVGVRVRIDYDAIVDPTVVTVLKALREEVRTTLHIIRKKLLGLEEVLTFLAFGRQWVEGLAQGK